ncbi:hypothetical protein CXB51_018802 [Gossypium anomalum]|uniref:K+ potassium transporter integral membrane domain-containing protein n=1 Tax=Gossypium anomalum TaxID=47600 RepID=A0A8J5YEN5_9ROSI|nr:hypothetical protein CXB51_018802 [Gossypium anomalum]
MFADLSHFSYAAIQAAFTFLVYPALILAYMGQAAYSSSYELPHQQTQEMSMHVLIKINKLADLEGDYPFIKAAAPCPYSLACRFARSNWKVKKLVDKEEDEVSLDVNAEEACETDDLRPLKKANYSCRYIPVGILDVIPQRLNWRPPSYYGRDDLETLMASDSTADWICISKMLLGKVPDGLTFALKHKSNAYDHAENG